MIFSAEKRYDFVNKYDKGVENGEKSRDVIYA